METGIPMNDLTFFTNETDSTLLDRFKTTLINVQFFDVLVGYFRSSGFYLMQDALENIDKIRILIGLNIDQKSFEIIEETHGQLEFDFLSHQQAQHGYTANLITEMERAEDNIDVERGVNKFIEYIRTGKLEIKAHPSHNIHAKVYISRFKPGDRDFGRVITGSSNFSQAGLKDQYEFNVELKDQKDVTYALTQFENLWKEAIDLNDTFINTITHDTWLNNSITPYELYLKLLYEYFKEDINLDQGFETYLPEGFLELDYQKQAVVAAKKVLDTYGGVFIADVVGLGKTFVSALLAQQLNGRKLIICPPVLVDYWKETFNQFGVFAEVESLGKLDKILKAKHNKYDYIFIDEAHRFRNEITQGYDNLAKICRGKKIILVSATPLNNKIDDIYAQLKLFLKPKQSLIPGLPNLEKFFAERNKRLKNYKKGTPEYVQTVKEISKDIRENILKYVMVRRTRTEIMQFFKKDIENQGLRFPVVDEPHKIIYKFDEQIDPVFDFTVEELVKFTYARYMPLTYLRKGVTEFEEQSQLNVVGFMKGMLVKRLESSFYAFKLSVKRFIISYEKFIEMYHSGTVYISKAVDVYELLDADRLEDLETLVNQELASKHFSNEFKPELIEKLNQDLDILKRIDGLWKDIQTDPKLDQFKYELMKNSKLQNKMLIFTESAETGEYLYGELAKIYGNVVMFYHSNGGKNYTGLINKATARELIKINFDPNNDDKRDDIRILITTDVLSEGINLHATNTVVNYDLPWNPTRVLQRVGRVNRVGTKFDIIEIFNFFPTSKSDYHLGLEDNIKAKLFAFQSLLGEDAKYITNEEEVGSFGLFGEYLYNKLNDKNSYTGEDIQERSELEYLQVIRQIRDDKPDLFDHIKHFPRKARTARYVKMLEPNQSLLISFFRVGLLKKFIQSEGDAPSEISFMEIADQFRCQESEPKLSIPEKYFDLLHQNKSYFEKSILDSESDEIIRGGGHSNEQKILMRLKTKEIRAYKGFTDDDEEYLSKVRHTLEVGAIPKLTAKNLKKELEKVTTPLKVLLMLKKYINESLLESNEPDNYLHTLQREVILSEYFLGE
jgi:superfamily II DNA or RNA helicase/HKD family nuclease